MVRVEVRVELEYTCMDCERVHRGSIATVDDIYDCPAGAAFGHSWAMSRWPASVMTVAGAEFFSPRIPGPASFQQSLMLGDEMGSGNMIGGDGHVWSYRWDT